MRDRFSQREQVDAALRDVLSNFPPAISGSDHSMQPKDAQELLKSLTNGIYERHPDSAQRRQNIISVLGQLRT